MAGSQEAALTQRTWKCQRQTAGKRCHHTNPKRKHLCERCHKRRPATKRPAHMAALDLTYEVYIELNGGEHCGICQAGPPPSRRLDRDHDHVTGKPRGLLCRKHNRQVKRWLTLEFARLVVVYLERTI